MEGAGNVNRRRRTWECAAVLLAAALLWALFGTARFDSRKIWADVPLDTQDGKTRFSAAEDSRGVKSAGPYYDLPAGEYRLKWRIDSDGENAIRLSSSNGARIEPDVLPVAAGSWEGEGVFRVLDPVHNLSVGVEFLDGETMTVRGLRLYAPPCKDRAFAVLFVLLAVFALYAARRRGLLRGERGRTLLVVAAAALLGSAPSLTENVRFAWDAAFHTARIMNLADALRAGQIPARVGAFSYNGWGAATSVFYPDLFLYPSALMVLGGASVTFAANALVPAAALLAGLTMAYAAKRMLGDGRAAAAAAVLYVLSAYRLQDVYERYMLGEMLAMGFLPLFLWSLWEVLGRDRGRWPALALTAAAIVRCHLVSALFAALLALVWLAVSAGRIRREPGRLAAVGKALGLACLLSLSQLVPMAQMYVSGVNTQAMQFGFAGSALTLREALMPGGQIGLALLLGSLAAALSLPEEEDPDRRRVLLVLLLTGCASALLATRLFPWELAVRLTRGAAELIQFPWRFMMPAAACLALCGGHGLARQMKALGGGVPFAALALALLCVSPYLTESAEQKTAIAFGEGANPYMVFPEYQIAGTDVNDTRSREPSVSGGAEILSYEKEGTRILAQVRADAEGTVSFPLFGFPGYEASLNGERTDWTRGANNRLTVPLSAGAEGTLSVRYAGFALWRVCDAVSLAALAAAAVLCRRRKHANGIA